MRGGRREHLLPELVSRSSFCILDDASYEAQPAGPELKHYCLASGTVRVLLFF